MTSPHGIFSYASPSTVPSAHPAVGPGWGLRGLHTGTGPAQLQATLWLPTGKQQDNTISEVTTSEEGPALMDADTLPL